MDSLAKNLPSFANRPAETPPPPTGVLLASYFEEDAAYAVRRAAGTSDWLISYTVAGVGRYRLGDVSVTARTGDVVLLAPGTPHDYATDPTETSWCFFWAHFIPRDSWYDLLNLPAHAEGLTGLSINDEEANACIQTAFKRLVQDSAERRAFQEALAQNALEEILIRIAQQNFRQSPRFVDPRVEQVQDYMDQHYYRAITLKEIADVVSLSPWRISHLYKSETGLSITQSLTQIRLQKAAQLLAYTSRTVAEVAADTGFESAYYFSRVFKRQFGEPPLSYRKSQRAL
jgi:AraC family transcriptional regulator, arabinose operon regulatory protein